MHAQNLQPAVQVGQFHGDAAVEAAGAQQRLVEDLGAVRRAEHDDALLGVESVHLGQQLVQRLLALVVAADAGAVALLADGVDFVDEHDAGRLLRGLPEQVAHARRAGADEHLDERRAGHEEERAAGLAGHGLGQQRFAGAGRADQQRALRDLGADGGVAAGVFQNVDDFNQRLLGLVLSGHVAEARLALLDVELFGAAPGEAERAEAAASARAAVAAGLAHAAHDHDDPEDHDARHRQIDHVHQNVHDGHRLLRLGRGEFDARIREQVDQVFIRDDHGRIIGGTVQLAGLLWHDAQRIFDHLDRFHFARVEHVEEFGIGNFLHGDQAGLREQADQTDQQCEQQQEDPGRAQKSLEFILFGRLWVRFGLRIHCILLSVLYS